MGCEETRESIELDMLIIKLQKIKLNDEREAIIKEFEEKYGIKIKRKKIPNYIDYKEIKIIKNKNNYNKNIHKDNCDSYSTSESKKILIKKNHKKDKIINDDN